VTIISENGLKFLVDIQGGQKTGYYLDQRDNRLLVQTYAGGADVLDCFSYTGGFSIHALKGGAKSVHSVDSAGEALEILKGNQTLNEFDLRESTQIQADVFFQLRKFRDEGRKFDLIILDPPKFASISSHVPKAARAYKDINLLAFKLLRPNGYLFTFSCSGGVSHDLFGKIVAGAALDAKVNAKILHKLSQSIDHPIHLAFPESEYLKGLVVQVM
jgi:23S rRNA (cytosine1962-C5)-methyltransferase